MSAGSPQGRPHRHTGPDVRNHPGASHPASNRSSKDHHRASSPGSSRGTNRLRGATAPDHRRPVTANPGRRASAPRPDVNHAPAGTRLRPASHHDDRHRSGAPVPTARGENRGSNHRRNGHSSHPHVRGRPGNR